MIWYIYDIPHLINMWYSDVIFVKYISCKLIQVLVINMIISDFKVKLTFIWQT